jgi:hypothetical protein
MGKTGKMKAKKVPRKSVLWIGIRDKTDRSTSKLILKLKEDSEIFWVFQEICNKIRMQSKNVRYN